MIRGHLVGSAKKPEHVRRLCTEYLGERTGTYEFRTKRFGEVFRMLLAMGLEDGDTIVDVGAGPCEFDFYLRHDRRWRGIYLPVDGAVDGTDLERWSPKVHSHFFTCIEVLEHLYDPSTMLLTMTEFATKGVVCTTPNPEVVDVLGMDRTHICELPADWFRDYGYKTELVQLFDTPNDTVLAWKAK